ncbi:MAG: hypothetical protein M1835_004471 [Candelina submexicana]|nr:MAG: hypothetical protein M1835_004471 [Candelina submexicana]
MHNEQSHPLLAQVPLTVSPFVSLPTATTLPYTYKSLPSTLPPSSTGDTNGTEKPKYVVSSAGHAAHPDEVIASCRALQAHLQKMQDDAERTLRDWNEGIKERELAEKRRVAPGWLDRDEKILEPQRAHRDDEVTNIDNTAFNIARSQGNDQSGAEHMHLDDQPYQEESTREGEELDRAFGGLRFQ